MNKLPLDLGSIFLYSSMEKIGRIQFITHFLILLGFSSIIWYILTPYIQLSEEEISLFQKGLPSLQPHRLLLGNTAWIMLYGISYYLLFIISSKRYLDIGWNNRTPKLLIITFIFTNLWSLGLGIYSAYLGNPFINLLNTNYLFQIFTSGIGMLGIGSFIGIILMCFFCMVFPGLNESNS